jgi:hypothetical protein
VPGAKIEVNRTANQPPTVKGSRWPPLLPALLLFVSFVARWVDAAPIYSLTILTHSQSLGIDEFFVVEDIVRPGQTISSSSYDRRPGGKGANQAVALAKAGARSRLSGSIGADGRWMLLFLREAGVDVDMVAEVPDVWGVLAAFDATQT